MQAHGVDAVDWKLREMGYQGYDINRIQNMGYSKPEILQMALDGKKPKDIKPAKQAQPSAPVQQPISAAPASSVQQVPNQGGNDLLQAALAEKARRNAEQGNQ
jgi:hypothetical protein